MKITHDIHSNLTFWIKNQFCIQKNKDSTYHFCISIDANKIRSAKYFALFPDPLTAHFPRSSHILSHALTWCMTSTAKSINKIDTLPSLLLE